MFSSLVNALRERAVKVIQDELPGLEKLTQSVYKELVEKMKTADAWKLKRQKTYVSHGFCCGCEEDVWNGMEEWEGSCDLTRPGGGRIDLALDDIASATGTDRDKLDCLFLEALKAHIANDPELAQRVSVEAVCRYKFRAVVAVGDHRILVKRVQEAKLHEE